MDAHTIIVGGGIGGAVLANLLVRAGKRVIILEKNLTPVRIERPEVLWPATLKTLSQILPPEQYHSAALPIAGMRWSRSGRTLLEFRVPAHSTHPAAGASFTDPNRTRDLLLNQPGFEVRRGVTISQLLKENGRVVGVRTQDVSTHATADLHCQWVVGDDGRNSIVRKECGIPLDLTPLPVELLTFAFDWPARLPAATVNGFINDRMADTGIFAMAALPFPDGRGVALVLARSRALEDAQTAGREFQLFLSKNPDAAEIFGSRKFPQDLNRFHTGYGNAPAYGAPGAFLIGDAAHPVTPAGGQGANLSAADGAALAEILLADNSPDPLAEFYQRRSPAAERSIRLSRGAERAFSLPDAILSRLLVGMLRVVGLRPMWFAPLLKTPATSFVEKSDNRSS